MTGLATRERALLEPEIHQLRTLRDFEALEAVLEEQARTFDRASRLAARRVRPARPGGELRGRGSGKRRSGGSAPLPRSCWDGSATPRRSRPCSKTIQATRTEDADVREIALRASGPDRGSARGRTPSSRPCAKPRSGWRHASPTFSGRHGDVVVDPMIAFLAESTRHPARAWAANILGELRAPRAFPVLVHALRRSRRRGSGQGGRRPGAAGRPPRSHLPARHLLTDPAPFVRARIAGALGQFNET